MKKNRTTYFNHRRKNLYQRITFYFNKDKDKEIIDILKNSENKTDYIRQLIRNDYETKIQEKEK